MVVYRASSGFHLRLARAQAATRPLGAIRCWGRTCSPGSRLAPGPVGPERRSRASRFLSGGREASLLLRRAQTRIPEPPTKAGLRGFELLSYALKPAFSPGAVSGLFDQT